MNCATEYAQYGITANNIAPGVIVTDRNSDILADDSFKQKVLEMVPAGRFGDLKDCAGLALLLSSDAGSYITGADIPVAGGMQL
jgi:NAD(P)-dependent dehydrogenase (short-subunit alcohol dehydrogenase family)